MAQGMMASGRITKQMGTADSSRFQMKLFTKDFGKTIKSMAADLKCTEILACSTTVNSKTVKRMGMAV